MRPRHGHDFHGACESSIEELARLFTACYEGYPYPAATDALQLARRIREESIALDASFVLHESDQAVGLVLLALRGHEAWCGGFGVRPAFRGLGWGQVLADEMVRRAAGSGAARLRLEVLVGNGPALRTYERAGLHITREVLVLAWRRSATTAPDPILRPLDQISIAEAIARAPGLVSTDACWQRSHASLLSRSNLEAYEISDHGARAWAICVALPIRATRLLRLWGENDLASLALLERLKERLLSIGVVNEPADSPILPLLTKAGFTLSDRQYDMELPLAEVFRGARRAE